MWQSSSICGRMITIVRKARTESGGNMDRSDLQLYGGILLGIFFLILVTLTIVYIRRRASKRRDAVMREGGALSGSGGTSDGQSESKGYWINKDDIEDGESAPRLRCYHYFDNIDECIHDLIVEMYDCGLVRTEDIFTAAYGEKALTPDSFIYMTDRDGDIEAARAALPPVSEKSQKLIYDLWASFVEELLGIVELHTSETNQKIIKDALMVYGRKKVSILLRSPE